MASTFVNDLRLNEMATGDESGNWGVVTNTSLELIGEALGYGTEGITTNADTHTSTIADGATDPVRAMYVEYTGTLDSACTITIAPNTINRMHFIENGTSGSQNIIISQGSGANITIPPGDTKAVYLDGAGSGAAVVDAFASLSVVDLTVEDDLFVTDDLGVGGDIDLEGSIDVNGTSNLDVVDIDGAVDMASTLQVDGAITNSSTIVSTGKITADAGIDIDNFNIDGTTIALSSGDMTIDTAGDLILDAAGNDIKFLDNGTQIGQIEMAASSGFHFRSIEQDADLRFKGNDGGSTITALLLDMSAAGLATFNAGATFADKVGIGTTAPASPLHVKGTTSHTYLTVEANSGVSNAIKFIGANEWIIGNSTITGGGGDNDFSIQDGSVNAIKINGGGAVTINEGGADLDFRVETSGSTHMFFVDAGANKILMSSNPASDTQSTPHDTLKLAVAYASSGTNGAAGLGPRLVFAIPDDEDNPSVGGGIAVVKESGDDSDSSSAMIFSVTQNDETLDEAMRISSAGNVGIGATSDATPLSANLFVTGTAAAFTAVTSSSDGATLAAFKTGSYDGASNVMNFYNAANGVMGRITATNGNSGTAVSFTTSSDYRLKENIKPLENGLDRLNKLNPIKFDWKGTGISSEGFIAHEAQEIFSDAVTGEKDAEEMQSMDYGRITPLLVKAIQEQQTIIEDLKTRITTLEGE